MRNDVENNYMIDIFSVIDRRKYDWICSEEDVINNNVNAIANILFLKQLDEALIHLFKTLHHSSEVSETHREKIIAIARELFESSLIMLSTTFVEEDRPGLLQASRQKIMQLLNPNVPAPQLLSNSVLDFLRLIIEAGFSLFQAAQAAESVAVSSDPIPTDIQNELTAIVNLIAYEQFIEKAANHIVERKIIEKIRVLLSPFHDDFFTCVSYNIKQHFAALNFDKKSTMLAELETISAVFEKEPDQDRYKISS